MIVGRVGIVGRLVSKVGRVDKKWGELAVGRVVLLPVCYTPESGQLAPQPNRPHFSTNSPPFSTQLALLVKKKFPTRPPCEVWQIDLKNIQFPIVCRKDTSNFSNFSCFQIINRQIEANLIVTRYRKEVFLEKLICLNENFTSLHWTLRFNISIILQECFFQFICSPIVNYRL